MLREPECFSPKHRISIDYFHGNPSTGPVFAELYEQLKRQRDSITRLRVSHSLMETQALEAGLPPARVRRIPIGIEIERFEPVTRASRASARRALGLPEAAVVIGSFQKDGVGWGEGLEPKMIKGPDVLVAALVALKDRVPELTALLTGPARGFVKNGLSAGGVPFVHLDNADKTAVNRSFHALDAYAIASRDEGGPKSLLEAMAVGIPVVTTRVGQAIDLARSGENAWVVESEDVDGLVDGLARVLTDGTFRDGMVIQGRRTAEANSHGSLTTVWADFFHGYLES